MVKEDDRLSETQSEITVQLANGGLRRFKHDLMTPMPLETRAAKLQAKACALIGETQAEILRDVGRVSGWTQWAAGAGGGRVFAFSLDRARDQAWATAERLHRVDEPTRAVEVAELDHVVTALAYMVTRPSAPVRWLLRVPRWLELDDPGEVTRRLLGHLA